MQWSLFSHAIGTGGVTGGGGGCGDVITGFLVVVVSVSGGGCGVLSCPATTGSSGCNSG